ncbi:ER-localized J domain-containing protein [Komagataella phaffii CBS 7435]|uniref:Type I membrane protein with a J domain is required to preserve the folding capacity of the ER n=2 Tax=Komagataella phaffii TaxID=460519 RepID=C4QVC1_KOMPG|nr:Type I membrane protein with a J domain is required to preserve the folding capacity of the ER [Komagataella phaffii GS115]AOA61660.1 GQ67_02388T0 [Komagataella phaffii]CAH2445849.1 ER-localized J domain-containing protein [Komagataella phaffii CBS 7435]AOA66528.1 GQ68_02859T0 [Komagataella phaffii GS115]CAY67194.1 Type I membrane protein with a J domain is required to preserve the folding capacity of the ER [Komagataella phaffii GS115]CCA36303.1 ER-localized J domain-containing protein [Ko
MKLHLVILCLITAVYCFSAVDREIFQLNHELRQEYGDNFNFYEWLKLPKGPSSTFEDIDNAYKKLSRKLHPDKIRQKKLSQEQFEQLKKKATERYQQLSAVGSILRSESKERYDYFVKHGFPVYKGNDYTYAKFRPSVLLTIFILFALATLTHFVFIRLSAVQSRKRLSSLIEENKQLAWPQGVQDVTQVKDVKVYNEHLRKWFLVCFDGSVHYVENDKTFHVDPEEVELPSWQDTLPGKLIVKLIPQLARKPRSPKEIKKENLDDKTRKTKKPTGDSKTLPNGKTIYKATKSGGRRRK